MLERSKPSNTEDRIRGGASTANRHDSAHKHVAGEAVYIDDLPEPAGLLHAYLGLADRAHARIVTMDLDAVRASPGVVDVLKLGDIPGEIDISPVHKHDEPVFAKDEVLFHGHPLFAVIATTRDAARRAAKLADVTYEELPAHLDVDAARAAGGDLVGEQLILRRGDAAQAIAEAPRRIRGTMLIGGQDHFYLEGQIALAIPGEDEDVTVHSSTQHPSETQHMIASALGIASHSVTVEVRRMGGAFGGKESQGNLFAVVAALAAKKLNRAVKLRPDRDDDMIITGKRHDFRCDYDVGFDEDGRILGIDFTYAGRCGYSADLSIPVCDRALFHCDNSYFYPHVHAKSEPLRTHTVSNTAFRGFGGPQGMVGCERVIDEIAYALGKDPLEIRKLNFYGTDTRNVTPYHQTVDDNIIAELVEQLEQSAAYAERHKAVRAFNAKSRIVKRGIALVPVKFGISFTATQYNQAGALVHVYRDGSVHLNHGGTEMGQGVYIKVAQVVAEEFQIDLDRVKITATTTAKVPNTSATAASTGSDLNGMAAREAARTIRNRLCDFAAEAYGVPKETILFLPNRVRIGNQEIAFPDLVEKAYLARISLSSTGFYRTPHIHWDRASGSGRPFFYYAYGASVSEVAIDTLTGEYCVLRTDILHDCGRSLNPAIDIGQIEGGFVQGMGWLTTEELWWDDRGRLRTHAPSTYKIPVASDVPPVFNVTIAELGDNRHETIYRSKAVGEPPFMHGLSVFHAIADAVASVGGYRFAPNIDAPATPERVLFACQRLAALARG